MVTIITHTRDQARKHIRHLIIHRKTPDRQLFGRSEGHKGNTRGESITYVSSGSNRLHQLQFWMHINNPPLIKTICIV